VNKTEELNEKIRKLTVERVQARVVAREAERLASSVVSHDADLTDRRIVRDEARIARAKLNEIEQQLETAKCELRRLERLAERPELERRLIRARKLVSERDKLAAAVQRDLEALSVALHNLDALTAELHGIERDPRAGGRVGATGATFHPLNLSARLRAPLALAVRRTSYSRLVRQFFLTPKASESNFALVEQAAGQRLISQIERQIAEIDALDKEGVA